MTGTSAIDAGDDVRATVIVAPAARARIDHAKAWLEARAPGEEVLVLGPSPSASNDLTRILAKAKGAAFGWHCLTLGQLATSMALPAQTERGLASITPIGTAAVVARLVHRLTSAGQIGRFASIATTPGFPRALAAVITELRLTQVVPAVVASVAPDLGSLFAAYEAELADTALTDWPGILALAAEGAPMHRLAGLPLLMLDVLVANTAELALLRAIAAAAPDILATVPAADHATLTRLRDELHWRIEVLDGPDSRDSEPGLNRLRCNLFQEDDNAPAATTASGSVEIFSAPVEGRECVEIARRAVARAREGIAFDRIAVFLRSPETYRAYLEEAFNRAGIPVYFARGARRPDPVGRAFLALLKCAADRLSARRFAEYLSLGQLPDASAKGAPPPAASRGDQWAEPDAEVATAEAEQPPPIDAGPAGEEAPVHAGQLRAPRRWEQLLVEAAVIGSRDRWQRRLEGLANDLRARRAELADEDETAAAAVARTLDDLAAFTAFAMPLIELLASWPSTADWGGWLEHLGALATRALKHPDRVLALLAELAPLAPIGPISLSEVVDVLAPLLLEQAVPPPPQRYGSVFVGSVETARGLSFDTVFVPGLAERMFPRKIIEEPILLDSLRERIGAGLVTNVRRLEDERLALALATGAAESRICFSYPRLDLHSQPRPRVPSFYALEALRASEGRLPDFTELATRAATATTARLGWPAPREPADAIDSAEYDLAILDRLATAGRRDSGAARYLIGANPWLARALRARYQRWRAAWSGSDGLVSPSRAALAAIGQHGIARRAYSPTALQHYARCPYRFLLSAIHRLAPRIEPEPIDELDPLQRGALIHDIQFELLARLRQEGLLPIRPAKLDRAWQELDATIAGVAARYHDNLAPAIARVWLDGIAAVAADLREWLRRASLDATGFVPRYFELSFGIAARSSARRADPRSTPEAVALDCGLRLRGSIDLVESHEAGLMRVTDHKTGKADARAGQIIAGGKTLQPLFYALVAEKLFAGEAEISVGRLYFCTARGGFTELEVALDDATRAAAEQVAETIGNAVTGGFLPAYPDEGECGRCDYRAVCGPHEEHRVRRKPANRVEPLIALREAS